MNVHVALSDQIKRLQFARCKNLRISKPRICKEKNKQKSSFRTR